MNQVYDDYEKQKVDNVSDPEIRSQMPISTISGVNDNGHSGPTISDLKETSESSAQYDLNDESQQESHENKQTEDIENELQKVNEEDKIDSKEKEVEAEIKEQDSNVAETREQESIVEETTGENSVEETNENETSPEKDETNQNTDQLVEQAKVLIVPEKEPNAYEILGFDPTIVRFMNDLAAKAKAKEEAQKLQQLERKASKEDTEDEEVDGAKAAPRPSEPASQAEQIAAERETAITNMKDSATGPERPGEFPKQQTSSTKKETKQHIFSPGPRAPPFRIPEFKWSYLHQELLNNVLFSLEQDVAAWKTYVHEFNLNQNKMINKNNHYIFQTSNKECNRFCECYGKPHVRCQCDTHDLSIS